MSSSRSTGDYFGTFLSPASSGRKRDAAPGVELPTDQVVVDQVMVALRPGPQTVKDLLPAAGNSLGALLKVMSSLQSMNLVEKTPDGEQFQLTGSGREIAQMVTI